MMTHLTRVMMLCCLVLASAAVAADTSPGSLAQVKTLHVDCNISEQGKAWIR